MDKLVVMNQRGGVGKTTTAMTLSRLFADDGKKTLLVDADPQGSINTILRLKPEHHLFDFVIKRYSLDDCTVSAVENLDVLLGNRETADAEKQMMMEMARERVLETVFEPYENNYDSILIDVGPSVSLMQTCAMVYTRQVLIPVNMDYVSLSGVGACLQFCETLSRAVRTPVRPIAIIPTMVDRRIGLTKLVRNLLEELSQRFEVPILHEIRTDTSIGKATRERKFLADLDPRSKAMEDYCQVYEELKNLLRGKTADVTQIQAV
jgi:chromosome partitioning protein